MRWNTTDPMPPGVNRHRRDAAPIRPAGLLRARNHALALQPPGDSRFRARHILATRALAVCRGHRGACPSCGGEKRFCDRQLRRPSHTGSNVDAAVPHLCKSDTLLSWGGLLRQMHRLLARASGSVADQSERVTGTPHSPRPRTNRHCLDTRWNKTFLNSSHGLNAVQIGTFSK
jgi:hypothetical protein